MPVTQMTRLDCVRRLKESQLVIRLMVRCRGALRPEVVSAERKERSKVPPELPAAPPPVPPRKLRHSHSQANRGSADGEASPGWFFFYSIYIARMIINDVRLKKSVYFETFIISRNYITLSIKLKVIEYEYMHEFYTYNIFSFFHARTIEEGNFS